MVRNLSAAIVLTAVGAGIQRGTLQGARTLDTVRPTFAQPLDVHTGQNITWRCGI